jgi:molybdopterin converting factor subunit 1
VTVQLFARLREIAGCQQVACELPAGSTAVDLWRSLAAEHPDLADFGSSVSCAINADFAPMSTALHDGDDVAFLPPVSGGAVPGA